MAVTLRAGVQAGGSFTAGTSTTRAFAGAVSAGDLLFFGIRVPDETTTVDSVSDDVNGAYTLVSGPEDNSGATNLRMYLFCFPNSAAGTPTVTANFSASITGHTAVCALAGAQTSATADALGTSRLTSGSGDTTFTSNAVNNVAAGGILGLLVTNASMTITASTGTDSVVTTASTRCFFLFTAAPTVTSYQQSVTGSASHSIQMITSWAEASAGGAIGPLVGGKLVGRGILGGRLQ